MSILLICQGRIILLISQSCLKIRPMTTGLPKLCLDHINEWTHWFHSFADLQRSCFISSWRRIKAPMGNFLWNSSKRRVSKALQQAHSPHSGKNSVSENYKILLSRTASEKNTQIKLYYSMIEQLCHKPLPLSTPTICHPSFWGRIYPVSSLIFRVFPKT